MIRYVIFTSLAQFESKNQEILQSGVCGNAVRYADVNQCKHPTLNKWAMPVLEYTVSFFNEEEILNELPSDWIVFLDKK